MTTQETRAFRWTPAHVVGLLVLCTAQVLDGVDVTVVNVALPAIASDLGFSEAALPWVINAYMVPFGGFLLLGGRLGDLRGRRKVLVGGISLFAAASLVSALAQNPETLIGARAVQGLAAALIAPMTLALIGVIFPSGPPRNRAFAAWAASYGVSSALGLLLGGALTDGPGWRWIFFVNLPIGVVLLVLTMLFVPADQPRRRHHRFDIVGAVTSTAGIGLLVYAVLDTADHPWGSARTIGLVLVSAALLGWFVMNELRVAEPLVSFTLFRLPGVAGATIVSVFRGSAMFALFYFATLYQQQVLHLSALQTGLNYLPMTVILVAASALGPTLVRWIGIRMAVVLGALLAAGGLVIFATIAPQGSVWSNVILPSLIVCTGLAIVIVPSTIAALNDVPQADTGIVSALQNVSLQLGGALGLAVLSSVVTARTTDLLAAGESPALALTSGFGVGFAMTAGLMVAAATAAALMLRDHGRGERVDMSRLSQPGFDE
ncbi:DHA2 family efflux MFS transporter permease subunit [Nonomuraea harbinensis]|uniref:DHA2 family efflux MFS transporter permease subunit n=1 Tax=Nonomuraea harbinensis TaxID=1286938 RepID=A0ABW1BUN9_9ACTN|nr:DHA2 family efflux MFS transporter permease subunit [Nonomuraea harbinensis]